MTEHGTRSRYVDGCRCDRCRQAERDYQRGRMRKWRRENAPADVATIMRKLRRTRGSGGVRLSYQEAELVLSMLEAGAKAVARERATAPSLNQVLAEKRRLNAA